MLCILLIIWPISYVYDSEDEAICAVVEKNNPLTPGPMCYQGLRRSFSLGKRVAKQTDIATESAR